MSPTLRFYHRLFALVQMEKRQSWSDTQEWTEHYATKMDKPYIKVTSVTYAIKGRDFLRRHGFKAYLERGSFSSGEGCGYSIFVRGDADAAENLLKSSGFKVLGRSEKVGGKV